MFFEAFLSQSHTFLMPTLEVAICSTNWFAMPKGIIVERDSRFLVLHSIQAFHQIGKNGDDAEWIIFFYKLKWFD